MITYVSRFINPMLPARLVLVVMCVCVWVCVWACRRISADQRASDHHLHQLQLIIPPYIFSPLSHLLVRSLFVVLDVWCPRLHSCSCSRGFVHSGFVTALQDSASQHSSDHQSPCATILVLWTCTDLPHWRFNKEHLLAYCFRVSIMTERSDPPMEAASGSTGSLDDFVSSSILRMNSQERNLSDTARAVQALVAQVSELTQQFQRLRGPTAHLTPPVPLPSPEDSSQSEPRLPVPASYTGEPDYCRAFLTRCSMHFSLQPRTFSSERTKVAFVLTLLTGRAALWGTAVWENQDPCCASFQDLSAEMRRVFDRAASGREAARRLADLRQGERTVSDFSIEFRTLAAESQWNEEAQWDMFLHGLADRVQKEIYAMDLPTSLNDLVALALRVDTRLSRMGRHAQPNRPTRGAEDQWFGGRDTVNPVYDHEPMQVGRARLSREEKERRRSQGLCMYCGGEGHLAYVCPLKGSAR